MDCFKISQLDSDTLKTLEHGNDWNFISTEKFHIGFWWNIRDDDEQLGRRGGKRKIPATSLADDKTLLSKIEWYYTTKQQDLIWYHEKNGLFCFWKYFKNF